MNVNEPKQHIESLWELIPSQAFKIIEHPNLESTILHPKMLHHKNLQIYYSDNPSSFFYQ